MKGTRKKHHGAIWIVSTLVIMSHVQSTVLYDEIAILLTPF